MDVNCCPSPDVWERYVLGRVDEPEQHVLDAHLASCPDCLRQLEQASGEDTLVADLRTRLNLPPEPPDPTADRVISHVVQRADTLCWGAGPGPAPADPGEILAPPQEADEVGRLGPFRVLRMLGRGGMGVVFLAEDTSLRRPVALKVLDPDLARRPDGAARFLREARAAAALRHERVVTIYQVGEADGPAGPVPFLAMELLEGESLGQALARGPIPTAEVVRIGREICEGLDAAHRAGVIHRDVKPDNIWLEGEARRVKLLDFGLARAGRLDTQLTRDGVVIGTPAYMAPEQAAGRPVDHRADLFGLGCVLYRMCTGRLPFPATDVLAILTALATREPLPVREINPAAPPALAALVHRLLAKDPARRPASAEEVATALRGIGQTLPSSARPAKRRRRFGLALGLAAVLVAAAVAAAVVVIRTPHGPAEFVIDTDDPDFAFRVDGKGGVDLEDRKTERRYQLKVGRYDPATGEYEVDVTEPVAGIQFSTKTLTVKRGERVAMRASARRPDQPRGPAGVKGVEPPASGPDRDWLTRVARLPADEQVAAVTARLKEINPGFEGPVTPRVEDGVVVGLEFPAHRVTNVSPVRGLAGLRELSCAGTHDNPGWVTDLKPLAGLRLRVLSVANNIHLSDLGPLEEMPLEELYCYGTVVVDLVPLQKCPLTILDVGSTKVTNLAPLKGLPLTRFRANDSKVTDLGPLAGIRLVEIWCGNCKRLADLGPLKGMPLEGVNVEGTGVADLGPLKGAPVRALFAPDAAVAAARKLLEATPTLETINDKPHGAYWADVDAKKP
ncbi:protein kinase domain-containing protein [Fimbriiglobus ruber]|uniref:non-specific serine/threonine protein kinase n=1 Tax=Fimbriiglobus ruber TaxID=1908690 RepID=A0A225DU54_9BACT|nr:protein kinase [Fimbriiglobus ruber]OWK39915.1 Serine/threonine-protein kinase pkn3 [Fimbriiglobus ruber]